MVGNKPSGYSLKSMKHTRALATFSRAWQLLRSFRFEQTRPDIFYGGWLKTPLCLSIPSPATPGSP